MSGFSRLLKSVSRGRISRRLLGGALVAVTLAATLLAIGSSPAAAHTRLLETIPENRTVAESPPERLTLVFAEAIDPRTVHLDVIAADGGLVPGPVLLTSSGADQAVIEFSLPPLDDGVYGLSWITVGPDGHRVAGEVVIGVGVVDGASVQDAHFTETPPVERVLSVAAGVARYLWYFGLAAVAGSMLVLAWGLRPGAGSPAKEILSRRARRALVRGSLLLHVGILVRAGATITLVTRGYRSGSLSEDLQLALTDGMGLTLLLAAVAAGALVVWAPRLSRARSGWTLLQAGLGVMALVAIGSATSHTAVLSEDPFGIWVSTLHLTAAALWLGPLLVVGWATASGPWRARPAAERAATLRELFGRFGPVAVGAFAVLVVTGARSTWLLAGSELLSGSGYTTALIVKLALLAAVILPLGTYHDRRLGLLARRRPERDSRAAPVRSLRLEAGAMASVLVVAAVLAGLNPAVFGSGGGAGESQVAVVGGATTVTSDPLALLSDAPPESVEDCRARTVGKPNCYRDYFAEVMRNEGADVAVAEIDALSESDEYIARDCHQVVHDLGNDAAEYYGDVGIALTYEGSPCWSGYYHGVVEYAISQFSGTELFDEMPNICTTAAQEEYSFTHYNCVHGLGHGVMLNLDGDLFGSIPYCETLPDRWELSSCVGGAIMENVVSAQQGIQTDLRTDDLIYPCNVIGDDYVDECFAMQTSWMLYNLGYEDENFAEAFAICDSVQGDMVDNCYRSMGRDISGSSLLKVSRVVRLCSLGDPAYQEECFVGASLNAVYNDHGTEMATALCEAIPARMQDACYAARDRAAGTF
ncbi:MAG: copper resistance protein CopC/CopD [Acidimicrobiia bacterium]|nr:copper resistance protein CopC/CopD [Acidimicrobiia bacterium]